LNDESLAVMTDVIRKVVKERAPIMKAACTLSRLRNGNWLVRHSSATLGTVEVTGSSREEALSDMRDELQFRSEWCPCSGASADKVELHVSEDTRQPREPFQQRGLP
jgi:hypothetical protein